MVRRLRMPALLIAVALTLSAMALAHDDDDYRGYSAQAQRYGYQQGYKDGVRHGKDDYEDRRSYNVQSNDWDRASRGYSEWMGSFRVFQNSYRDGYQRGYDVAYNRAGDWRDDHGRFERDGYRYDGWETRRAAQNYGFEDGCRIGREDTYRAKPFNPYPRSGNHADRGYRREYGDKNEYREEYSRAYRQGYESVFRR